MNTKRRPKTDTIIKKKEGKAQRKMLETLRLMRRQHFKMAEKHQWLQADKKVRKEIPRHEETKPSKEIFQEFLLTWNFALPHYSQQSAHTAAFAALHTCVTAACQSQPPKFTLESPRETRTGQSFMGDPPWPCFRAAAATGQWTQPAFLTLPHLRQRFSFIFSHSTTSNLQRHQVPSGCSSQLI